MSENNEKNEEKMSSENRPDGALEIFEEIIGYKFKDKQLLRTALTHSSYANEMHGKVEFNERLEFLGDSVLGMVTAEYFYKTRPDLPEGKLTKNRAARVCEKSLHKFAKQIDLGEFLRLGKGEIHTGGRERPSILADAFEAVIAAIYLDSDYSHAKEFVLGFVANADEYEPVSADNKTMLQEIIQRNHTEKLEYVLVAESGPDHDKQFTVEVHLNSNVIGVGTGHSKKVAEQNAAKEALRLMGIKQE